MTRCDHRHGKEPKGEHSEDVASEQVFFEDCHVQLISIFKVHSLFIKSRYAAEKRVKFWLRVCRRKYSAWGCRDEVWHRRRFARLCSAHKLLRPLTCL